MTQDKELKKLMKEVNTLKKKKQRAMKLSNSMQEREQLLREINQLEAVKKNPSALKSFGKTFGVGLKRVGTGLWGAVKRGSSNLSKNSPEFQELGRSMTSSKPSKPFSPMMGMYMPRQNEPMRMNVPRKLRKAKMKSPKKFSKEFKRQVESPVWGLP